MSDYEFKKKSISNYRSYRSPYLLEKEKKSQISPNLNQKNYYTRKYRFQKNQKISKNENFPKNSNSAQKIINSNFLIKNHKSNLEKISNSSNYQKKRYMKFGENLKNYESSYNNSEKNSNFIIKQKKINFLTQNENFYDKKSISNENFGFDIKKNFYEKKKKFLKKNLKINSAMNSLEKNRYIKKNRNFEQNSNFEYLENQNLGKIKKNEDFKILLLEKKNRNFSKNLKKKEKEINHIKKIMLLDKECLKNFEIQKNEMILKISNLEKKIQEIKFQNENLQNENFLLKEKKNFNIKKSNENLFNLKKRTSLSNKNEHIFSTTFSEQLYGKLNEKKFKKESGLNFEIEANHSSQFTIENNLENCEEKLKKILENKFLVREDEKKLEEVISNLGFLKNFDFNVNLEKSENFEKPLFLSRIQKDLETLIKNINLKNCDYKNKNIENQIKQLKKNLSVFIKKNNIDNKENYDFEVFLKISKICQILKISENPEISENFKNENFITKSKNLKKGNFLLKEKILKFLEKILKKLKCQNFEFFDQKKNSVIINESYLSLKTFQNNLSSIIYEKEKNVIFETNSENISKESLGQNIMILKNELENYKKFLVKNFEKVEKIEKENFCLENLFFCKNNKNFENYENLENLKNRFFVLKQNLKNLKISDEDQKFDLNENERILEKNEKIEEIKILKEKMVKKNLLLEEKNSEINFLQKEIEKIKKKKISEKKNFEKKKILNEKNFKEEENFCKMRKSVSDRNITLNSKQNISQEEKFIIKSVNFENSQNSEKSQNSKNFSNFSENEKKSEMVNEIEDFIKEIVEKHKIEKENFEKKIKILETENKAIISELDDYKIKYQKLMIVNLHMKKIQNENNILKKKIIEFENIEEGEKGSYILSSESDDDFEEQQKENVNLEENEENIDEIEKRKESVNFFVIENILGIFNNENFEDLEENEFLNKFEVLKNLFEKLKFKEIEKKEKMIIQLDQYKKINSYNKISPIKKKISEIEKKITKKKKIKRTEEQTS